MTHSKSVVVTGCGVVTAGGDLTGTWDALMRQEARVQRRSGAPIAGFPFARSYGPSGFDPAKGGIPRKEARAMGDAMCYASAAAWMAIRDAGLTEAVDALADAALLVAARFGERDEELDLMIGNKIAAVEDYHSLLSELLSRGLRPGLFLAQLPNLFAGNISLLNQIRGPSLTFVGEHGASGRALTEAVDLIRDGSVEVAIAGGCYNAQEYLGHYMLASTGVLSPDAHSDDLRPAAPWTPSSDGTVPGTAAAFVVFESLAHAQARGAAPKAFVRSVACNTEVRRGQTIAQSLQELYGRASASAGPACAIIGHGSGISSIDRQELEFLSRACGEGSKSLVTTPTATLGECVHAALPLRVALATAALVRQELFGFPAARAHAGNPGVQFVATGQRQELRSVCALALGSHESESLVLLERFTA